MRQVRNAAHRAPRLPGLGVAVACLASVLLPASRAQAEVTGAANLGVASAGGPSP
jgi:hypothetical protein